jgi:ligand-binding SRPBCC domain-containing protein
MRIHEFNSEVLLPLGPDELFPFFADASNLDSITPPWLHFNIITPQPIEMRKGALIDYRLRVRGFPLSWRTRINVWQPPYRFVDEQLRGPYRQWIHEHSFEVHNGGTMVRDSVHYVVPFDWLVHRWFVRGDVEKIFRFRKDAMKSQFGTESNIRKQSFP